MCAAYLQTQFADAPPIQRAFACYGLRLKGAAGVLLRCFRLRGLLRGVGERLHILRPVGETYLLWCIEEALRAAPIGLAIAEPEKPLSLTAVRRLQLAAEVGGTTGLQLVHAAAGSNTTETRYRCEPLASPAVDSTLHHWSLNENKNGTLEGWIVNWDGTSTAFNMVFALRASSLSFKGHLA